MSFIIYISIVVALLIFKLWWDYRAKNKKKRIINHLRSGLIDSLIYLVSSFILFFWIDGRPHTFIFGMIILALSFRWIFFDLIFAKLNWGVWDFHGQSSNIDGFMIFLRDGFTIKIFKKEFTIKLGKYHFLVKLIPIIIGVILILL